MSLTSIEICGGAGGQALGLEQAGFDHLACVEIDKSACETLRANRAGWNVIEDDVRTFSAIPYKGVDLVAGGVPCPPFSKAGKQLGRKDERDLFPSAIRIVREARPHAVMLENVRGLSDAVFADYRSDVERQLSRLGYVPHWQLLNACDFGVSQLRPRYIFVGLRKDLADHFTWPVGRIPAPTVGEKLFDLMASRGWLGASRWRERANKIAPTLVGGSRKHGGPDLGPTRAKKAWALIGVDGMGIADEPPGPMFDIFGAPKLTTRMTARLQGFEDDWEFVGRKTAAYRQIGNAFPPPVARAVGRCIVSAFESRAKRRVLKAA
jgi:DNA (cytosine-5)-methyltransferase 1